MKKIILIALISLLVIIIIVLGLYYWQVKIGHFSPVGPGLPPECFIVFKPEKSEDYSNLVLGILNKDAYNPITRQQGETIFPYFLIKKANNGYYYGWMQICLFGVEALSNNERLVILKDYKGGFYFEGGLMFENPELVEAKNILYDNFKFAEYYYCYEDENEIINSTNYNNVKDNCRRGY